MIGSIRNRVSPRAGLFAGALGVTALFGACMAEPAGISSDDEQSGGTGHAHTGGRGGMGEMGGTDEPGGAGPDQGGTAGTGATAGTGTGGEETGNGGSNNGGSGTTSGGTGADATGGMGGANDPTGGSSGDEGGAGGDDDGTIESCVYHSAPIPGGGGGTGGMGGAAGAASSGGGGAAGASGDVTIRTSPFVGNYLADAAGRTLYFYGSDLAGDCTNPPVSRCTADCLVTWLPFNAGARLLAPGLDDAAFGTIQGNHGGPQTTYYGWPLYYYKDDTAPAQLAGQGKAKVWHVVEVRLPTVVIMREGSTRYLADAAGRTLYVSSADQIGNDDVDPESHCEGPCLMAFQRMHARNHSVVQSLEQDDFWSFVNPDGSLQLGYKGAPLYRSKNDRHAGDMTGTATAGFTAAVP